MPLTLCNSGKLMAGMPQSVHNVQNTGSPVEERPFGAAPVAATDNALVSARRSFWRTLRAWFGDDHARPPGKP